MWRHGQGKLQRLAVVDPLVEEVPGEAGVDENLQALPGLDEDVLWRRVELVRVQLRRRRGRECRLPELLVMMIPVHDEASHEG